MKKFINSIFMGTLICSLLFTSCMSGRVAPTDLDAQTKPITKTEQISSAQVWDGQMPEISNLRLDSEDLTLTPLATGKLSDVNLAIPTEFNITRPSASEKFTTTYDKYFITGTSDPKKSVYFGDSEIERIGSKGTFGVLVDLNMGVNTFNFSQNGKTQTVTITRKAYVPTESIPITEITQSSMVPANFSGAKVGGNLDVGCIAPSGATVTATFDGKSVNLKQVPGTQKAGMPAFFKGSIVIDGSYDKDVTQNAGKVTYQLDYNGKTKKYTSIGDVYIAGENSAVAVRVKNYVGFVYPDLNNLALFKEKLKNGAVDYLKSQDNNYAELNSGGYVPKEQLEIVEGKVSVSNKLNKVKASTKSKSETYTFTGTNTPAYVTKLSQGKFSITLFNTTGSPGVNISGSKLFSDVAIAAGENSTTYTFTQNNSSIWGYNVSYNGKNTELTFNYKPVLSTGSKPFSGLTIVIDPGHGGTDKGAMGIANTTGPAETDVNLAHAYATRDLLASMGANVVLTRSEDTFYSLDDRLKSLEAVETDMFISLHHNSIGENTDANKISGVEVYYHTGVSKTLADSMMTSVTSELGRKNRFVNQSYYRVTLSSYAPSILVELGYMSNPLEYERSTSESQINKVAHAVASGITQTLF